MSNSIGGREEGERGARERERERERRVSSEGERKHTIRMYANEHGVRESSEGSSSTGNNEIKGTPCSGTPTHTCTNVN